MNSKKNVSARVRAAEATAAIFLLPPHELPSDRMDALHEARGLILRAIEPAVRAGRDDLARKLLDVLHIAEA